MVYCNYRSLLDHVYKLLKKLDTTIAFILGKNRFIWANFFLFLVFCCFKIIMSNTETAALQTELSSTIQQSKETAANNVTNHKRQKSETLVTEFCKRLKTIDSVKLSLE